MDSKDILQNPAAMMEILCDKLDIQFDSDMLSWPKGYRNSDGIWASHWYNRVIESTGFAKYSPKKLTLNVREKSIANSCMPYYLALLKHAFK
ncbi:MAG: hypothetical protein JKY19_15280 [Alcanivoracaceae bacterium]|nr:hypothetical protein [Alcanivoracaceae bacterium]